MTVLIVIFMLVCIGGVVVVFILDMVRTKKWKAQEKIRLAEEQKYKENIEKKIKGMNDRVDALFFLFKTIYPNETEQAMNKLLTARAEEQKLQIEFDDENKKAAMRLSKVTETINNDDATEEQKGVLLEIKVNLEEAIKNQDTIKIREILGNFDEELLVIKKQKDNKSSKSLPAAIDSVTSDGTDQFGDPIQ